MVMDWKTLPPLSALRAFQAVAEAGGYAQAARTLNVTHAAVAQQVRALEAQLGRSGPRTDRGVRCHSDGGYDLAWRAEPPSAHYPDTQLRDPMADAAAKGFLGQAP